MPSNQPTNTCIIRQGIYNTLTACGPYGSNQVSSCDYGILQQNSGCAVIFHPLEEESDVITYRGAGLTVTEEITMQIGVEVYIPFAGNSPQFNSLVWQARDDLKTTIRKDTSLQGSACFAWANKFSYDINEGYEMGHKDWGVVHAVITVKDM